LLNFNSLPFQIFLAQFYSLAHLFIYLILKRQNIIKAFSNTRRTREARNSTQKRKNLQTTKQKQATHKTQEKQS
jgi:hypothetical protein